MTYRYITDESEDGEWTHTILDSVDGETVATTDDEQHAVMIVNALNLQEALRVQLKELAGVLKGMTE